MSRCKRTISRQSLRLAVLALLNEPKTVEDVRAAFPNEQHMAGVALRALMRLGLAVNLNADQPNSLGGLYLRADHPQVIAMREATDHELTAFEAPVVKRVIPAAGAAPIFCRGPRSVFELGGAIT